MKWELILKEVEKLVGRSNAMLYQRATLLVQVSKDARFREHHGNVVDAIEEHLSQYLADYGLDFQDVELMLRYYPAQRDWEQGKLREMLAESMDRRDAARGESKPQRKRAAVTLKEHEATLEKLQQSEARAKSLADELVELRKENRDLVTQLARSEGRIAELELAVKYPATA